VVAGEKELQTEHTNLIFTNVNALRYLPFISDRLGEVASDIISTLSHILNFVTAAVTVDVSVYDLIKTRTRCPWRFSES